MQQITETSISAAVHNATSPVRMAVKQAVYAGRMMSNAARGKRQVSNLDELSAATSAEAMGIIKPGSVSSEIAQAQAREALIANRKARQPLMELLRLANQLAQTGKEYPHYCDRCDKGGDFDAPDDLDRITSIAGSKLCGFCLEYGGVV